MDKTCSKCGETKPVDDFFRRKASSDGRMGHCKKCSDAMTRSWEDRNPEKVRAMKRRQYQRDIEKSRRQAKEWRERNPEKVAARNAANRAKAKSDGRYAYYRYGLTTEQITRLAKSQNQVCAICERPIDVDSKTQKIDHDHETGAVRGLLCNKCNPALGWYEANAERIAIYLTRTPPWLPKGTKPATRVVQEPMFVQRGWTKPTHCKKGHELSVDNVYLNKTTGARRCKICARDYQRASWRRKNPDAPHRIP